MKVDCERLGMFKAGRTLCVLTEEHSKLFVSCTDGMIRLADVDEKPSDQRLCSLSISTDMKLFNDARQCRSDAWLGLSYLPRPLRQLSDEPYRQGGLLAAANLDGCVVIYEVRVKPDSSREGSPKVRTLKDVSLKQVNISKKWTVARSSLSATACAFLAMPNLLTARESPMTTTGYGSTINDRSGYPAVFACASADGEVRLCMIPGLKAKQTDNEDEEDDDEDDDEDDYDLSDCSNVFTAHKSGVVSLSLCDLPSNCQIKIDEGGSENQPEGGSFHTCLLFVSDCDGGLKVYQVRLIGSNSDSTATTTTKKWIMRSNELMSLPKLFTQKRGSDLAHDPDPHSISTLVRDSDVLCFISGRPSPIYLGFSFSMPDSFSFADGSVEESTLKCSLMDRNPLPPPPSLSIAISTARITVIQVYNNDHSQSHNQVYVFAGFTDGTVRLFDCDVRNLKDSEDKAPSLISEKHNKSGSAISSLSMVNSERNKQVISVIACDIGGDVSCFDFNLIGDVTITEDGKKSDSIGDSTLDDVDSGMANFDLDDGEEDDDSSESSTDDEMVAKKSRLKSRMKSKKKLHKKKDSSSSSLSEPGSNQDVSVSPTKGHSNSEEKKKESISKDSSRNFSVSKFAASDEAEHSDGKSDEDVEMEDVEISQMEEEYNDDENHQQKSEDQGWSEKPLAERLGVESSLKQTKPMKKKSKRSSKKKSAKSLDDWIESGSSVSRMNDSSLVDDIEDPDIRSAADMTAMMTNPFPTVTNAEPPSLSSQIHPLVHNQIDSGSLSEFDDKLEICLMSNEIGNLFIRKQSDTSIAGVSPDLNSMLGSVGFEYEIEFYDKLKYRNVKFRQTMEFTLGAINTDGIALCKKDMLRYRPFRTKLMDGIKSDWTHVLFNEGINEDQMSEEEDEEYPVCLGLSRDYVLLVTSHNFVRLFTVNGGLQCDLPFSLNGTVVNVCCSPFHNTVLIVYQAQLMTLNCIVFDFGSGYNRRVLFEGPLPLSYSRDRIDKSRLLWTHVSKQGKILSLDSDFYLRALILKESKHIGNDGGQSSSSSSSSGLSSYTRWIPLMNLSIAQDKYRRTRDEAGLPPDEQGPVWPIFWDDQSDCLMVSLNFPKAVSLCALNSCIPMIGMSEGQVPGGQEETGFGSKEEHIWRDSLFKFGVCDLVSCDDGSSTSVRSKNLEKMVNRRLKEYLQLFRVACQMRRPMLALDICREYLASFEKALLNCQKIALHFSLSGLATQVNRMLVDLNEQKQSEKPSSNDHRSLPRPSRTLRRDVPSMSDAKESEVSEKGPSFEMIGRKRKSVENAGPSVTERDNFVDEEPSLKRVKRNPFAKPSVPVHQQAESDAPPKPFLNRQRSLFDI